MTFAPNSPSASSASTVRTWATSPASRSASRDSTSSRRSGKTCRKRSRADPAGASGLPSSPTARCCPSSGHTTFTYVVRSGEIPALHPLVCGQQDKRSLRPGRIRDRREVVLDQSSYLGRVGSGHVHERVRLAEVDRPVRALLGPHRCAEDVETLANVVEGMDIGRLEEHLARLGARDPARHDDVAPKRQQPPVERLLGEEVVRSEPGVGERSGAIVAGEAEPERRDQPVQARLEDVPLVEAVLAQRKAGMDRRRVNGRRRREAGRPPFHVRAGEERVVRVTVEEAPAEGVEVDEDDPRMRAELLLDQPGQLVEAAAQSRRSAG